MGYPPSTGTSSNRDPSYNNIVNNSRRTKRSRLFLSCFRSDPRIGIPKKNIVRCPLRDGFIRTRYNCIWMPLPIGNPNKCGSPIASSDPSAGVSIPTHICSRISIGGNVIKMGVEGPPVLKVRGTPPESISDLYGLVRYVLQSVGGYLVPSVLPSVLKEPLILIR